MLILVKIFVLPYNRFMTNTSQIIRKLRLTNKTLAVAESCTGGFLGHTLTNISGSSNIFIGGVIAYQNRIKQNILMVPKSTLEKYGAVSRPTAIGMSEGVKKKFHSDFGISITGIAGPTGGSAQKPIGLTYISVSGPTKTVCKKFIFNGTRLRVKKQAAGQALIMLSKLL